MVIDNLNTDKIEIIGKLWLVKSKRCYKLACRAKWLDEDIHITFINMSRTGKLHVTKSDIEYARFEYEFVDDACFLPNLTNQEISELITRIW